MTAIRSRRVILIASIVLAVVAGSLIVLRNQLFKSETQPESIKPEVQPKGIEELLARAASERMSADNVKAMISRPPTIDAFGSDSEIDITLNFIDIVSSNPKPIERPPATTRIMYWVQYHTPKFTHVIGLAWLADGTVVLFHANVFAPL